MNVLQRTRITSILNLISLSYVTVTLMTHSAAGSATKDDFVRLYENLTGDYRREMRPVVNQSAPVLLDFSFDLFSVLEIKDIENEMDFMAMIRTSWTDEYLTWNPADYGGIDTMHLTPSEIWTPQLATGISRQTEGYLFDSPNSKEVSNNGYVTFTSVLFRNPFCELDMTYFPYDYQQCTMTLTVMDSTMSEIKIRTAAANLGINFAQNREWIVRNISMLINYLGTRSSSTSGFVVTVFLQRRPTFCNLNIITPAIIMCVLCILTFFVPIESGERLSYTLTTLLALSVYITYIGGLIPESSDPIPILVQYIVALFVISSLTVIFTLIVIKLRWSVVEKTSDGRKYIYFLGVRIFLSRKRWANKIDVIPWFRGDQMNDDYLQNVGKSNVDKVKFDNENPSNHNIEKLNHINEAVIRLGDDMNPRRGSVFMMTSDKKVDSPYSPKSEDAPDLDPTLNTLCICFDMVSFCLVFITFLTMSIYTFVRFYSQEEPKAQ